MLNNSQMTANRFGRWAVARKKLRFITQALQSGRTVYLSTATRATKLQAKHLSMVRATKAGGLEVQSGKRWLDCNWCNITAK